jgi:hypothetical protein
MASLGDVALELAKKLNSTEAMVVLPFIAAVIVVVQLAAGPDTGSALWVVAVLLVVVEAAAVIVHRVDRKAPAKGLTEQDTEAVRAALVSARDNVATRLGCDRTHCRANVFGENRLRRLQIVNSLTVNMDRVEEWGVSIPPGRGGTGIAWATGAPKVLIAPFAGDEDLEPADAARVDPELEWVISAPVDVDQSVKWIVNVDGRDARTRPQVEAAVHEVMSSVPMLRPFAEKA